jgi:hypothetical protein
VRDRPSHPKAVRASQQYYYGYHFDSAELAVVAGPKSGTDARKARHLGIKCSSESIYFTDGFMSRCPSLAFLSMLLINRLSVSSTPQPSSGVRRQPLSITLPDRRRERFMMSVLKKFPRPGNNCRRYSDSLLT